jgi:hypothetical protein
MSTDVETIPLLPRRRLLGTAFGGFTSVRRGEGSDVASSRPYEPGDHVHSIDWKSSARVSSATGSDEFIVRERHAEEMARIVIVVDKRPEMQLYPPSLPWLRKPQAVAAAVELLAASALHQRALVGYADGGSHPGEVAAGEHFWKPPRAQGGSWQSELVDGMRAYLDAPFDAPVASVDGTLAFLTGFRGALPLGSIVFVLSDFIYPLDQAAWARGLELGWDIVPVVVQDPVWEQSFPDISGVMTPIADPRGGRLQFVRLDARDVAERRAGNEDRFAELSRDFLGLGLDTVLIGSADPAAVIRSFLAWVEGRVLVRGGRW